MNLAVVPARAGSKRIGDKNIVDFCGRPLISFPLAAAKASGLFDVVHVSTDSDRYAHLVRELGFPVDFLRDATLGGDSVGVVDVLRWVVREYAEQGKVFDDVCLVYATAALIDGEDLRRGHALFLKHGRGTPLLAVTSFPAPVQRALRVNKEGTLEPMFPESWECHSQNLEATYHDAGAFFFISGRMLLDGDETAYRKMLPCLIPRSHAADIDEPEDLAYAAQLYRGRSVQTLGD